MHMLPILANAASRNNIEVRREDQSSTSASPVHGARRDLKSPHSSTISGSRVTLQPKQSLGMTAIPNFSSFQSPSFNESESWNDAAEIYGAELNAGEQLSQQVEEASKRAIDLSTRTCWRYQQSFVQHLLRWLPIFDPQLCVKNFLSGAEASSYSSPSDCLGLFMLAVGAVTEDTIEPTTGFGDHIVSPGLGYFARGSRILDGFSLESRNLMVLQCRILHAWVPRISSVIK